MKANFITEKYITFRAINKDPQAFAQVYDLYVDQIYRFIYFKVPTAEEAQDLTSEAFLKTWQYIVNGNKIENLRALLYKVARNLVIDFYRKSRSEISLETDIPLIAEQEALVSVQQTNAIDVQIDFSLVEEKLHELKDEYREVIVLRHIEGLSVKEIAAIMEKKPGAIRITLYRALQTLKDILDIKEESSISEK